MNIKLYKECTKVNLPHNEKHVLVTLASYAARNCREAYPSVETMATDTGLGTTTVRLQLCSLKRRGVLLPIGGTKGGKNHPTTYRICPENLVEPNGRVLTSNPTVLEVIPNGFEGVTQHPGVDDGFMKESSKEANSAATCSTPKMEAEVLRVWKYYLEAFDKDEELTTSRKKQGIARLQELRAKISNPVEMMAAAIDVAKLKVRNGKKYFSQWHCIFGHPDTVQSLIDEYETTGYVPDAAELQA